MGLRDIVDGYDGFATTRELRAHGATERMLTAAVRAGILLRARNGWYSTRSSTDPAFIAVRVGGRLTGLSAIEAMGGWVWRRPDVVHVSVRPVASRIRGLDDPNVVIHWDDSGDGGTRSVVGLDDALVRVALDEDLEDAVACFDWAVSSGRLDLLDLESIFLKLPAEARYLRYWLDPRAQSVVESVARVRLRRCGWEVSSQVRTGLLGASDLVVEGQVALETDGREFHETSFETDRRRDLTTTREGRHVIRVSAKMVREVWPEIEAAVAAALVARRVRETGNSGQSPPVPHASQRSPSAGTPSSGVSDRGATRKSRAREYAPRPAPCIPRE